MKQNFCPIPSSFSLGTVPYIFVSNISEILADYLILTLPAALAALAFVIRPLQLVSDAAEFCAAECAPALAAQQAPECRVSCSSSAATQWFLPPLCRLPVHHPLYCCAAFSPTVWRGAAAGVQTRFPCLESGLGHLHQLCGAGMKTLSAWKLCQWQAQRSSINKTTSWLTFFWLASAQRLGGILRGMGDELPYLLDSGSLSVILCGCGTVLTVHGFISNWDSPAKYGTSSWDFRAYRMALMVNGRILAFNAGGPSSIPGCKFKIFFKLIHLLPKNDIVGCPGSIPGSGNKFVLGGGREGRTA